MLDQRTLEARREREVTAELVAHVGGAPSAAEMILIRRAARLLPLVELMERRALEEGDIGESTGRQFLSWINVLRMTLNALRLKGRQDAPKTLTSYLGGRAA